MHFDIPLLDCCCLPSSAAAAHTLVGFCECQDQVINSVISDNDVCHLVVISGSADAAVEMSICHPFLHTGTG